MKLDGYLSRIGIGIAVWVLSAGVMLFGCPKPGPAPVTPPDASDAAPPVPTATCDEACANVNKLGCKNPGACGALCPRVLNPAFRTCVAAATSCDAVRLCDQGVGNE